MDRNQAKEFYPILQAYAEGKVIECRTKQSAIKGIDTPNKWTEIEDIVFWNNTEYRIKPESKYRPFKDADECWNEMLKHQPFGWVKEKYSDRYTLITEVNRLSVKGREGCRFIDGVIHYTFADGTPFGIKEEE